MNYDFIIIGSGAGGSAAAYQLALSGKRILLLERGAELPRDGSTLQVEQVVKRKAFVEREQWQDGAGRRIAPQERSNLGGKTKWYGAALLRFSPDEFLPDPDHACLPWPIGYEQLAPYYEQAEKLLDVRRFEMEPDLRRIVGRLSGKAGWRAEPLPMGLAADISGHRDECRHFDGFASPMNLKADGQNAFIERVRGFPNLVVLTGKQVTGLVGATREPRRVAGVVCDDGSLYFGDGILLAAGALHSPRLLQTYMERTGLADRLPCYRNVGRHYKFHVLSAVLGFSPFEQKDELRKTTLMLHDAHRHSSAQPLGWFDGEMFGAIAPAYVPNWMCGIAGRRVYGFFLQTEDGSHADNRVIARANGSGLPRLDYDLDRLPAARNEHRDFVRRFMRSLAGAGYLPVQEAISVEGSAHACGSLVAGSDSRRAVVDAQGRVHGMDNLYVVDGSVLPRSGKENPALTIFAWSLRVASGLADTMEQNRYEQRSAQHLLRA